MAVHLHLWHETLRGWLLALAWIPLLVILSSGRFLPGPVIPLVLFVVGGGIVFFSMRRFLSGRDVPFAFGAKWELVQTMKALASRVLRAARLVPGIRNWSFVVRASLWASEPSGGATFPTEHRAWGRWLTPGAFPNEAFLRPDQQARAKEPTRAAGPVKTWRLSHVPADVSSAQTIRRLLARYPALRETTSEEADYQIAILSNKTPRRWVEALAARHPQLICIIVSSLNFNLLATPLQQHQWIDYRQQRPYQVDNLAQALTGISNTIHPTTPENFARTVAPYPVKLVSNALRMGGAASIVLGVAAQLLALVDRVALVPPLLIVVSVVVGVWAWWEAGRPLARNSILPELLLTWGALLLTFSSWLFSGAAGTLLPREVSVHNGDYNSALTSGIAILASFVGLPFLLFLFGGGFELIRNFRTLHRWLPRPGWPRWQRTLAVAAWHRLDFSRILYAVTALVVIATLVVDSPYHYQHIREYDVDVTSTLRITSGLLSGPDGNLWFGLDGTSEYDIGSISPSGDIQPRRFTLPEPVGCRADNKFACFHVSGLRFGPDHNLWYVAEQVFPPYTTEIQRLTLTGNITRFSLPNRGLSGVRFTFDVAGNVWYTREGNPFHSDEQSWIGRLDASASSDSTTEFALPEQSLPAAIAAGPDGNLWFFDTGLHAIGKISPSGVVTEYPLPYGRNGAGLAGKEIIVGPDHNLWFTDPNSGIVGRITTSGVITLYDGKATSFPGDLLGGPDGSIWFLDYNQQALGRISPGGQLAFYPFHTLMSMNSSLTVGPGGNIWVALYNQIGRVTITGALSLYDVPSLDADLWGIVTGLNRHLWFVEYSPSIIGELIP